MKKFLLLVLPFVTTVAMAQKETPNVRFGNLITTQALKEKLSVLASADMEGRETATPGQKKAAAYIEDQFKRMGLKPGNGNSYQQYYPVYQDELMNKNLSVNGTHFEWDEDYAFSLNSIVNGNHNYNNVVFVGYGLDDAANKMTDYEGLDVKGKIVIALEGLPEGYKHENNQTQGRLRSG